MCDGLREETGPMRIPEWNEKYKKLERVEMSELELSETLEWTGIKAERGGWVDFEFLYRLWVMDVDFLKFNSVLDWLESISEYPG